MPFQTGTIEAISIKPLPKPDSYGNTFRSSIKIGEDWFSTGTMKKDSLDVKDGANWTQLQKGMAVEFMFTVNGDFKNADKKTFNITDASNAQAPQAPRVQNQAPANTQGANKGSFVNPAEVGQCLNLAVEVLKLDGKALLDDKKVSEAIAWYKAVREKFNTLYSDVEATQPTAKKSKPKVEEPVDEYDDLDV